MNALRELVQGGLTGCGKLMGEFDEGWLTMGDEVEGGRVGCFVYTYLLLRAPDFSIFLVLESCGMTGGAKRRVPSFDRFFPWHCCLWPPSGLLS